MTAREPHRVLGVAADATAEEINTAYRRALRNLHPDTRPGDGGGDGDDAAPPLTVADLQAARDRLHERARRRARSPTPASGAGTGRAAGTRRDIIAGPVRYHGPADAPR